ncbi:beta-xylosidase [Klebsiella pneumoniae]|uniref:Beta-xylosidase n=1 Tax=Klebsiella pneumoniae TaxID=573 RepID=A0A377XKL4_KLEPN|nr:beta-xylosidase [Klebsiella pneumoniae]
MAGLTNYYNDRHWSFVFLTWNEINGKVIEVGENNRGKYTSYLKDNAIKVPDGRRIRLVPDQGPQADLQL